MASEWLSSGLGLPASYPGAENSDGGTGLTLCTQYVTVSAGWITKIRFWKTSIDTATSRTVGIYNHSGTLLTSEVTAGEPVGTAQWIEVTLTTPLALTAHTVLTEGFYIAVAYDQQKYPATANVFLSTGYYTSGGNAYCPDTTESDDVGGVGNGAFKYGTGLNYPDSTFNGGYYWVDALWTDVDPSPPTTLPESFQSDAFQADAFEANVLAQFTLTEGPDVAAFTTTSTTILGFDITEGPDVAAFNVTARTYLSFTISEGPDVAAFDVTSRTLLQFTVTEGPDIPAFNVLTGAMFSFDLVEGPDIPAFRTWTGDFTLGDADYIVVPYELQTASVPYDNTQTELLPDDTTSEVPDEWQRVDVDQTRGRRKK